jgi:hypothetical protein
MMHRSFIARVLAVGCLIASTEGCVTVHPGEAGQNRRTAGAAAPPASVLPADASAAAAALDPGTRGWEPGKRYRYEVKLTTAIAFGQGASAFDFDLTGNVDIDAVFVTPQMMTAYLVLPDAKIASRVAGTQPDFDKVAAEIRAKSCSFTLSGGRVVGMRFPAGLSATAGNAYRAVAAGLQFAHAIGDAERYSAEEYDTTGRYVAEYAYDPSQNVWHKRKQRYLGLLEPRGATTNLAGRVMPEIISSKGDVRLSLDGRPEVVVAEDELRINGAQAPVRSKTVVSLESRPPMARQPTANLGALIDKLIPLPANEPYGAVAAGALDSARINGMTFGAVVARLEQLAKDRAGATTQDVVNGNALAPADPAKAERSTQEDQQLFEALSALYRQQPQTIAQATAKIRAKSPAADVLIDGLGVAGTPAAQSALVELMGAKTIDADLRNRAGTTLARTANPDEGSIDALKALLVSDPYKAKALFGLGTYSRRLRDAGKSAQAESLGEFLVARLKMADSELALITVLRAITNSGYAGALPALAPYMKDERELVRVAAVRALQSMRDPKVDEILASNLTSDPLSSVRLSAIDAAKVRDASDALVRALTDAALNDSDAHVRYQAVELMTQWTAQRPELHAALEQIARADQEPRIRQRATNP